MRESQPGAAGQPHLVEVLADSQPVDAHALTGMRREDMSNEERMQLMDVLSTAEGGTLRTAAMTLATDISTLPTPPSALHAGHVLQQVAMRQRPRHVRTNVLLALGAVGFMALGAVAWQIASTPPTDVTPEQHRVRLEVDASHMGRSRPLAHDSSIPADTVLHLTIATSGPGTLFVVERWGYGSSRPVLPQSGTWQVEAGLHEIPFGVTPHQTPLETTYEAWLCPQGVTTPTLRTCRKDRARITWQAPKP